MGACGAFLHGLASAKPPYFGCSGHLKKEELNLFSIYVTCVHQAMYRRSEDGSGVSLANCQVASSMEVHPKYMRCGNNMLPFRKKLLWMIFQITTNRKCLGECDIPTPLMTCNKQLQ